MDKGSTVGVQTGNPIRFKGLGLIRDIVGVKRILADILLGLPVRGRHYSPFHSS